MSSAWSQLEQMLTCAICLDKFKNPRLLPCQHSFCGDACMDGLVDYARRQIKCPECRAEHRIPYQGVQSLPLNVTLIRFLELHARITGEEPEPVPTFMEKCSICGEKVEGVQRCAHCDKKVCLECKEAHLDLLRREIARVTSQSKRSVSKMREFCETLKKAEDKLAVNHASVRAEIEDSCKRLINDLQLKQKRLLEEVDSYVEQEQRTIDKLKVAVVDECDILESNLVLAEEKLITNKYQWNDHELTEVKEIYLKAMEFVRLFDPEIGDHTRKVRFILIPDFETLRKRLCDLGELKFSETAQSLIANSFQYCNATGAFAVEICQASATVQQQQQQQSASGYGLSHSNSNTNLGGGQLGLGSGGGAAGVGTMLELPNALMRSQSDHRLASQFQARLKQQQEAAKGGAGGPAGASSRYGRPADYETDSLRSRYAPASRGATGAKDYTNDLLRDWPRPSDNDSDSVSFGSSIHFKSAFMRRKEKERQQAYSYGGADDDDDLTSEASYGGASRNVRFYDQQLEQQQQQALAAGKAGQPAVKVFDCKEVEHAPLSGVPKLDECPQFQTRLHQLGAKAVVDKRNAEVEGRREKDLVDSARQAMSKASERINREMSGDEIEKQKQANKQQELQRDQQRCEQEASPATVIVDATATATEPPPHISGRSQAITAAAPTDPTRTSATQAPQNSGSASSSPATPTSASTLPGGRRSLYGQAVAEKSKRQLSSALKDAAEYTTQRRSLVASRDDDIGSVLQPTTVTTASGREQVEPSSSGSSGTRRRTLRSSGRSMSKQSSIEGQQSIDSAGTPTTPTMRRRRLLRGDSSQRQQSADSTGAPVGTQHHSTDSNLPKNSMPGSGGGGGHNDDTTSPPPVRTGLGQQQTTQQQRACTRDEDDDSDDDEEDEVRTRSPACLSASSMLRQGSGGTTATRSPIVGRRQATSTTTDDEEDDEEEDDDDCSKNTGTVRRAKMHSQRTESSASSRSRAASTKQDDSDDDEEARAQENDSDDDNSSAAASATRAKRNTGNRRSREFLPNAVNKLLDRSAQIRRDSQEQRTRADSPQRNAPRSSDYQGETQAIQTSNSYGSSSRPSGYSSSPGAGSSSSIRQRLASQRSQQSIKGADDDDTTNSNHSIYTTASSQGGRRSSQEDDMRRPSGSSTDRTIISARDLDSAEYTPGHRVGRYTSSSRRDSSGDGAGSSGGFQSRFLARSRTSAALSGGTSSSTTGRSRDDYSSDHHSSHRDKMMSASTANAAADRDQDSYGSSRPSYLTSRDRFMQSASGIPTSTSSPSTATTSTSHSSRTSGAVVPSVTSLGQYRHQPSARSNYNDNSPFLEFDDDDDEYSAYFPSASSAGRKLTPFRLHQQNQPLQRQAAALDRAATFKSLRRSKY